MRTRKARTPIMILCLLMLLALVAACSDNTSILPGDGDGGETTTTAAGTETTAGPEETTTTATPATEEPTTTAAPLPTAADSLAAFFAAAEDLDNRIVNAANTFNAGFDESAMTLSGTGTSAVNALNAGPVAELIPAGLSPNLERAVLAVYADLDSRIAAMQQAASHMFPTEHDYVMDCLALGGTSFYRFDNDLNQAKALAALEPPPTAAPDSEAAGVLAVRIAAIHSMNFGCESCGGVQYDSHIPVDWAGRTVAGGVNFDANFVGGSWVILIYAC